MSRWRQLQRDLNEKIVSNEKFDITSQDISEGRIRGTTYQRSNTAPTSGILLVGGLAGNRYSLQVLAERLAEAGFFCLSMDIPQHYLNRSEFTLGGFSEQITEAVIILKGKYGMRSVAVIGHSMGAVASLFSLAGYTATIEQQLYLFWDKIGAILEKQAEVIDGGERARTPPNIQALNTMNEQIEALYTQMKNLILQSLRADVERNTTVACYIFLAPPTNCKDAIPGLRRMKAWKYKWIKKIFEAVLHHPLEKQIEKEGNPVKYAPEQDPAYLNWGAFKTREVYEFIDYFLSMKEPSDYLSMIEKIVSFKKRDDMVAFFEYYQKRYILAKPKLFIYGMVDLYLRAFFSGGKRKVEEFYKSCGNDDGTTEIYHGFFSHVMMDNPYQQVAALSIKNKSVTKRILNFLDNYV